MSQEPPVEKTPLTEDKPLFSRGVIRPFGCISGGWQLIKGDYWLFLGITVVGVLLAGLAPLGLLAGPAVCGIDLCLLRRARGQEVTFEMLFEGFNYFLESLIATLIVTVATMAATFLVTAIFAIPIVIVAVMMISSSPEPPAPALIWTLVGLIGVLWFAVMLTATIFHALFAFTYQLIVDRKMSGANAALLSFKAVRVNFRGMVGLALLNGLLGLAGLLCFYFGIIFVLPISYAAMTVAYREVFPPEEAVTVFPREI